MNFLFNTTLSNNGQFSCRYSFVFIICFSSAWNGSNYYMKGEMEDESGFYGYLILIHRVALEQKNALKKERERFLKEKN